MSEMKGRPGATSADASQSKRTEPVRRPTPADFIREERKPETDPLRPFRR